MTKEEIYQKMIDCRRIADDVYCALWQMEVSNERTQLLVLSERVLEEIDYSLDCLRGMGAEVDAE